MASKEVFAARDFRYGTRMLVAGDPVIMTGPDVRLYKAMGKISEDAPKGHLPPEIAAPVKAVTAPKAAAKKEAPKTKAPAKRKGKAAK